MNKQKFLLKPFIGAVIITLIIIYGSLSPDTGGKGILDILGFNFKHSDKLLHGGFYFLLAASIYYGFVRQIKNISKQIIHSYSVIFPVILGGTIELVQWKLIETRHGEIADMAVNIFGIFLAFLCFKYYNYYLQRQKKK
jgi:hypothetical protein